MKKIRITVEGKTYDVDVEIVGENPVVTNIAAAPARASAAVVAPAAAAPAPKPAAAPVASGAGDIVAPLAATVVSIDVAVGQSVNAGDKVAVIEAMKMNTVVTATGSGTVKAIHAKSGDSVQEGQPLLSIG